MKFVALGGTRCYVEASDTAYRGPSSAVLPSVSFRPPATRTHILRSVSTRHIPEAAQSVSLRRYRAVGMEPAMLAGGLAVFLVIALGVGLVPIPGSRVAMLLFMGAVQLALPLVLFMRGARHVAAAQMVMVSMADALLNPLWVWLVHGEVPAGGVFAGGTLVLLAIAANTWPGRMGRDMRAT